MPNSTTIFFSDESQMVSKIRENCPCVIGLNCPGAAIVERGHKHPKNCNRSKEPAVRRGAKALMDFSPFFVANS